MNRYHALATQGELHRPERTGQGNPNDLVLSDVLDGQYFQDTQSGSVYRFVLPDGDTNVANGEWELLLGYDRETGALTNIGDFIQTSKIGETTAIIGKQEGNASGTITAIPARTYVQIRAGEDLRIVDANDTGKEISVTVSQDTNAGEVSIPVQEIKTQKTFQIGSDIIMEGSLFTAYNSVDPTKVQLGVERRDDLDSIGLLGIGISNTATNVTTVSLQKIDPPVILRDNQKIAIKNRAGQSQILTVNGDQTFSSTIGTITVDAFNPAFIYESSTTAVYEPSYSASSRITLLDDSISLVVSNVSEVSNSVASLDLRVSSTESSISALSSFDTSVSSAIAGINATTSSLQSQVNVLSAFDTSVSNAIAGINATTSSLQSQVNVLSAFDTNVSSALAGINVTTNALSASVNTSVQYNDTGAYIQLLAGPAGSEITLQADQINVEGVISFINNSTTTTIDGDRITTGTITATQIDVNNLFSQNITITSGGYIQSSVFSANTSGFKINADGSAEFNGVTNLKSNTGRFVDKLLVESTSNTTGFGLEYSGVERFQIYALSDRVQVEGSGSYITGGQTYSRYTVLSSRSSVFGGEPAQAILIPQVNVFNSQPVLSVRPRLFIATGASIGTSYTGRLHVAGDLRWDGTTSASANAGSNGAVPAQVAGYLVVNISGTNYKLPYFNS